MATYLSSVNDGSVVIITVNFVDEEGNAVIPNNVTWTLTDINKTTINSRLNVVATPASSLDILLSGDDLRYADGVSRVLTVKGDYDSTNGSGLPLVEECIFQIADVLNN